MLCNTSITIYNTCIMFIITDEKPKSHFVEADNFQVTWWPKDEDHPQISSQQTKGKNHDIFNSVVICYDVCCY